MFSEADGVCQGLDQALRGVGGVGKRNHYFWNSLASCFPCCRKSAELLKSLQRSRFPQERRRVLRGARSCLPLRL